MNQLYLIGGNDTIKHAIAVHNEIKNRKLNIALCVNLKAINKDIAYFDTCFGFESAVEETQRFIEEGYALSKSTFNSAGNFSPIQYSLKSLVDFQVSSRWMRSVQLGMQTSAWCPSSVTTCTAKKGCCTTLQAASRRKGTASWCTHRVLPTQPETSHRTCTRTCCTGKRQCRTLLSTSS